jgi:hypothetical protein
MRPRSGGTIPPAGVNKRPGARRRAMLMGPKLPQFMVGLSTRF